MPYVGGTAQQADPKFLMDRLMKNGYSRMQAAAIVGNLQRESGLVSNNMNKDEGAYGLMQWRGPRFEALQQFAMQNGRPWTDPGVQADFIAREMQTTERKNATDFLAAKTVDEASAALKPVIRYGDKSGPERAMHARNFFGASDAAPGTTAAPSALATQPPAGAQPAVSRETYAQPQAAPARGRGLRAGIESLGDLGAAYLGRAAQQMNPTAQSSVPAGAVPVSRAGLAAQIAGAQDQQPPSNLGAGVSPAPPGASEPPRFPGGVPLPRARPMTGPGLPAGTPIDPLQSIAELGSVVDPMRYDYG